MSEIEYKKSLIGEEDLLLGFGIVNQTRGTSTLPITKINSDTIPYSVDLSIKDKLDTIDSTIALLHSVSRNTIVPTDVVYEKGDIIWNSNPAPSGFIGFVCIESGTPGVWKSFGAISS